MKVLGLDLSLCSTGCVVIDGSIIVNEKLIKSKPSGPSAIDELRRLVKIKNEIEKIVSENRPDLAVIEGLAFCAKNTVALVQLAGLNYMVREMLYARYVQFIIIAPSTLKKFVTGKGNCPKELMLLEAYKRYHKFFTDNNLCDAYCLAKVGEAAMDKEKKLTKFQQEVIINVRTKLYEVDKIDDVNKGTGIAVIKNSTHDGFSRKDRKRNGTSHT